MSEEFENKLKEMFEKVKTKVIFGSTSYINIMQICFNLVKKLQKKNKEFKNLPTEKKEEVSRNLSKHIADVSLSHNIISEDVYKIIIGFIEHKDTIIDFAELIYKKSCLCIRKKIL